MKPFRQQPVVTSETALAALSYAMAEGAKLGVRVSVAVVDPGMHLLAFVRVDGAPVHGVETSRRKAGTSASTGRPTGAMRADLDLALPLASANRMTNIPGGLPLVFAGTVVGGLGVAGGTPEQDAAIAAATLVAIGADREGPT